MWRVYTTCEGVFAYFFHKESCTSTWQFGRLTTQSNIGLEQQVLGDVFDDSVLAGGAYLNITKTRELLSSQHVLSAYIMKLLFYIVCAVSF